MKWIFLAFATVLVFYSGYQTLKTYNPMFKEGECGVFNGAQGAILIEQLVKQERYMYTNLLTGETKMGHMEQMDKIYDKVDCIELLYWLIDEVEKEMGDGKEI